MAGPTTLRWIVTGHQRPSIKKALWVGDDVKEAVQRHLTKHIKGKLPDEFCDHTQDGDLPQGDPHPFYLPEDADDDGLIDHLVLHVPHGLGDASVSALVHLPPIIGRYGVLTLRADWLGSLQKDTPPGRLLRPSRVWCSTTPYVSNLHRHGPIHALRLDLSNRKFPKPAEIKDLPVSDPHGYEIVRQESDESVRREPKVRVSKSKQRGTFFRLVFPKPRPGPVAFGFACHIGLGLFHCEDSVLNGLPPDS